MSAGPPNRPPKVFISYAHESDALRAGVKALADWLGERGCEVMTDHPFTDRPPAEGWLTWMLQRIAEAEVVLVVCSPKLKARYEKSAPPDEGFGATYEGAIVTQHIYDQAMRNTKFFPILPDGGSGQDIPTALRPWSNGHCFPSGNERILRMVRDDPPGTQSAPRDSSRPGPSRTMSDQAKLALRCLKASAAQPFLAAVMSDFADNVSEAAMALPEDVVRWFETCSPGAVQELFWAVRRALQTVASDGANPPASEPIRKAATALYFLAACRLVDATACSGPPGCNGRVMHVPTSAAIICAIVATAVFGGELRFAEGEASDHPCYDYAFEVGSPITSDQQVHDFERAVFIAMLPNDREATEVALDSGPLSDHQRARLAARIRTIRHVQRASLALVFRCRPDETRAPNHFAGQHEVPILIPTTEATSTLLGMSPADLQAEIDEFWSELRAATGAAKNSPQPNAPQRAQPMSQPNIHVHASDGAQVAINTGNRAVSQAGSHQTAEVGRRQGSDLSELGPILAELLAAVGEVSSAKARERLAPQIEVVQAESTKDAAADPKLIESTLKAVKSGAELLEDGGKIISLCNKAYQVLAPAFGLPTSPLP